METGSSRGIMRLIAVTGIWPWLWLAAVVICGRKGAGGPHTRIRPFSVGRTRLATRTTRPPGRAL